MARQSVEDAVRARADASGLVLDGMQSALLAELSVFAASTGGLRDQDGRVGYYVHGPAGRGKTWILQAVFDALPVPVDRKRRVHFHTFFHDLQQRFGTHSSARAAIDATVEEMLDGTSWFLFDELHVHDPAGASLLNRLLAEIAARRTPTLMTSNYAPDGLLPNPIFHHVAAPGIAVLRDRFEVRSLDGGVDYRRRGVPLRAGFAAGRWIVAADDAAARASGIDLPGAGERTTISSGLYAFDARAVRGGEVWFDFADLLEAASTAQDYLRWTETYDRWVVTGVPRLSKATREAAQRMVWLVDVLADADRPLTVVSNVDRATFVDLADVPPDLFRTASRLALLAD